MKHLNQCIVDYFTALIGECEEMNKLAVRYLREAILEFLEKPGEHTADEVYNSFFDAFRMRKGNLVFFDILDALRTYESQTSGLTENQRDHFTHSVWVFLLGLGIFSRNRNYRSAFGKSAYAFLYQWGLVSLLHDIGYPVEITFNQLKLYVESMIDIDGDSDKPNPYFEYGQIDELLYLHNNSEKSFINYLAENMAQSLGLDYAGTAAKLQAYPNIKGTTGYIDHGFYSAIMMMRWNGILIEKSNYPKSAFDNEIVGAATAILLHNYYKRPLQQTHKLPPLTVKKHPLAFMIILCDELQEWNRTAFGRENKRKPIAEECEIFLSENQITVSYALSVIDGADAEETANKYSQKKIQTLTELLSLSEVFGEITPDFVTSVVLEERRENAAENAKLISSRPLLEDLEAAAKIIHEKYRAKYPDSQRGKLSWEECSDHFRYDNVSQARHLFDYVAKCGYLVLDSNNELGLSKTNAIDPRRIEEFAIAEHDRWVKSKTSDGWRYGEVHDDEKKLHPQIVPYEELSEDEKDKDRAPLIEFIATLYSIGKGLYKLS